MARKRLETLTEQMFYVLLSLRGERHGYGIMQAITELTGGRVSVGAVSYTHLDVYKRQLWIQSHNLPFRIRGYHPLWPAFPYRSPSSSC